MKKLEIEVPEIILDLPEEEKNKLIDQVFFLSIKERLKKLKNNFKTANKKLKEFEEKYGKTLEEYENEGVGLSQEAHDDYMDWCYWREIYNSSKKIINKYEDLVEDELDETIS